MKMLSKLVKMVETGTAGKIRHFPATQPIIVRLCKRNMGTRFRSGALKPKPTQMPFGLVGVMCAVIPGLFVGAAISKSVANFLEENDLFVPADDEDDED